MNGGVKIREGAEGRPMTEAEWLACESPDLLLRHLKAIGATRHRRGHRRRRLRLLGCAAFGQAEHLLASDRGRRAIDLAEQFADGRADETDLLRLGRELRGQEGAASALTARDTAEHVVQVLLLPNDLIVAELSLEQAVWPLHREAEPAKPNLFRKAVRRAQAPLVRDIFGNPFRPIVVDPAWRTSTATSLARQIYESRDFTLLPILADALQDAGCEHDDILNHCRGPGPHVRGCWVVDALLGKT